MKILELTLLSNHLQQQKKFYRDVLELELIAERRDRISFQVGSTTLNFVESKKFKPYHFAFNIPAYMEEEGLEWLKDRVEILKEAENEIIDFSSWNARAMYFYDQDQNIVEFISRRNLGIHSDEKFSSDNLLHVSEIGVPTNNISEVFEFLSNEIGLEIYDGSLYKFCAVGWETGLFICINKNTKKWFPTDDLAYPADFKALIEEENVKYAIEFENMRLKLIDIEAINTGF